MTDVNIFDKCQSAVKLQVDENAFILFPWEETKIINENKLLSKSTEEFNIYAITQTF